MNTVALLKICSKALGTDPTTVCVSQKICTSRVTSAILEPSRLPTLRVLTSVPAEITSRALGLGIICVEAARGWFTRPKGGVDMGDHPPTPCRLAQPGQLSGKESRVYDLVARHFIATASPDAIFQQTVEFVGGGDVDGQHEIRRRGR